MKRQRNLDSVNGPTKAKASKTTTTKKAIPKRKIKRVVEKAEERKSYGGESTSPVEDMVLDNWEELKWLASDIVDEQMSWGSTWLPIWGVEYVGEAYGEMFGDVAWDEDIWNLKSINQIPMHDMNQSESRTLVRKKDLGSELDGVQTEIRNQEKKKFVVSIFT